MTVDAITIGALAGASGCKVQTVRYYEQIGLLSEPQRTRGNQRRYDPADVDRLRFIRHARELGFSIEAVRDLLHLSDHATVPCDAADALARRHLADVEYRIERLESLKKELERMVEHCEGGAVADCRVIRGLSDHGLCRSDHGTPETL